MDLEEAERILEEDLPTWRTELLERICGNLVNIGPLMVPGTSYAAYAALWNSLPHRDATDLLKHMAGKVLAKRTRITYVAPCPSCGIPGAQVTDYDCGRYRMARHKGKATAVFGDPESARITLTHYDGPMPPAARYEGDL